MGPVAQRVFKTRAVVQPTARSVRLRRRSVRFGPVAAVWVGQRPSHSHTVKLGRITLRAILVVAGVLLVVVAAKVFSRLHWEPGVAALAGNWVPPDLGVFLAAGDDVLHGRNPYVDASTVGSDFGYVYPPLLAWIISPLALVAGTTAATAWTLAMLACIVGTLWVLDVRDWRCYVVALVLPFTRAALEYGTIGPLLALLVAGTWRLRDRPAAAALTTGTALALKLFLWPLGLWFLVTGRARTAALTAVSALLLVLIPWAAIGFDGLAQYPDLLHKVADRQDYRTYSLTALTRALGGSPDLARAVALVLGIALIAWAVLIARKVDPVTGDRRSFLLLLAASLVLTPIL